MEINEIASLFLEWANEIRLKRKRITHMDTKEFLLELTNGDEEKVQRLIMDWMQKKY
jgi:hypothetical protein